MFEACAGCQPGGGGNEAKIGLEPGRTIFPIASSHGLKMGVIIWSMFWSLGGGGCTQFVDQMPIESLSCSVAHNHTRARPDIIQKRRG